MFMVNHGSKRLVVASGYLLWTGQLFVDAAMQEWCFDLKL